MTREQMINVVLSEYAYWRDQDPADADAMLIQMGAMAASSNLLAALMGRGAKWHSMYESPNPRANLIPEQRR